MMKKLLIFMLVFVMASSASATLTTGWYYAWEWTDDNAGDVVVGDTISVEIFAGDSVIASPILNTVLNVSDAASASNFALTTTSDWSYQDPTNGISSDGSGGYDVKVSGNLNAGKVPIDQSIYSFQFVTDAVGTVVIDAVSGNWSTYTAVVGQAGEAYYDTYGTVGGLPYAEITVVPEPMTIVLLGFGSLFLLRRRK
jgi:hypothetical protein